MPNRILREGILTSERVNALSWEEEVFYRRLMSVVDDFGRFYAHPSLLRAALYPLKLDSVRDANLERLLASVEQARLVRVYEVAGKRYLEMLDFKQQVRAKDSRFPGPPPPRPPDKGAADAQQMHSTCDADAEQVSSTGAASAPVFVFGGEGEDGGAHRVGERASREASNPGENSPAPPPDPGPKPPASPPPDPTPAALLGMAMRRAGVDLSRVNTSDPIAVALLAQGATIDEFEGLAREAVGKAVRDPWKWVLSVLPQRRQEAASIALAPKAPVTVTENPDVARTAAYLEEQRRLSIETRGSRQVWLERRKQGGASA